MIETYKICSFKRNIAGTLFLAILSIIFINCNLAKAEILRQDDHFTATFSKSGWEDMAFMSHIVEQKDGKILLAGFYDTINGTSISNISRFTATGTLDPDFAVGSGADQWVTRIGVQSDGRIILAGAFSEVNGVTVTPKLARLNANGSLDTSFTATANYDVWAMDISNNKITIGGQFTAVNGSSRTHVARLNADGTLDAAFNPGDGVTVATSVYPIKAVATIPSTDIFGADNSKVLVGGAFTQFNYSSYNNLVRLHTTGLVDSSFSIGSGFNNYVEAISIQPDGNYLIGGHFTTFKGVAHSGIIRLLSTGAADPSFSCAVSGGTNRVRSITLQEDGRIVIGGDFTAVNNIARKNVARLNPDGSLDMEFDPGSGPDAIVNTVTSTRQNQVIIGGNFQSLNGNDQIQVVARFNTDSQLGGGAANPYTVFAGGKDDWKQINLPRPRVNTGTLDLLVEGTIYYLSTLGPPVFLRLTYNSNLHNLAAGGFGKRWSFLYESSIIRQSANQVLLRKGTGEQETYTSLISLDTATPSTPVTLSPVKGTFNQLICYGTYWKYTEKDTRFTYLFTGPGSAQPAYLTSISDKNANTLTITTDPTTGRIQRITDSAGRQISFTYNPAGYCSRITVPDGRTLEFIYDAYGQLLQIKDMIGYLGKYTYDNGYIIKSDLGDIGSTGGGQEMTFTYSDKTWENGKYVSATQSASGKTLIAPVNNSINQVRWTDPRGQVTTVNTENGKTAGVVDPSGALSSLSYVEGLLSAYTSGNGKNTSFEYDSRGNTTGVTDALGKKTSYSYDAQNNLIQRQDALGNSCSFAYDANSNLTRVSYPNGTSRNFAYSSKGQLTTYTNALGKITGYTYDSYGNLTTVTAPDGGIVTYSYSSNDKNSRCYKITDSRSKQKSYSYDNNNRITAVSYGSAIPYDAQVRYSYDALNLLSATDELGKTTRVQRNENSLITWSFDPLNRATQFQYDGNGNLTKQTNPLGQSIQTSYNAANRPVQTTDPLNRTLIRSYDADGNLLSIRDASFHTTSFTYDDNNRLKTIRNPLNQAITKTYDALDRETETENSRGLKVIRTYDNLGNLLSKSYDGSIQVDYAYGAANNLLSSNHTTLGAKTYTYDNSGRVASITWPDTKSVSFVYDKEGHVTSTTYPGLTVSYSYDNFCRRKLPVEFRHGPRDDVSPHAEKNNQVTAMSWTGGSLSMLYNTAGNLLQESRSNGTVSSYLYDVNRKITAIDHKYLTTSFLKINNTYDAAGRRLSSIDSQSLNPPLPAGAETISYDNANQLLSYGSTGFSNDADGNVTAIGGSFAASYDAENRPVTTTINGVTTTYTFDGEGNPYRIVKNGVTHYYHFDHGGRLLFISDLAGNMVSRFIYRGNRLVAQQAQSNLWYFYHFDTNGNTLALTDSAGAVVAEYAYSPHGLYTSLGNPPSNPFTFAGQFGVLQQEGDIFLMTNRMYMATTGRFLQRDPLGLTGGVNLYVYAGNNPVGYVDPQGTFALEPGDIDDAPQLAEGTADLDTNELPYHTDEGIDPDTADDFAAGVDQALNFYGSVPGLPQGNFINAARAARDGNYAKATWETCKGAIGCIPGPGTAINITIDTTELRLTNAPKAT
ncbi:MAG: hypothetical protein KKA76_03925, partial [Proteobacteria bacterium]|nr:hypothetical protein [Pseudomonadota bacterium]